MAAQHRPVNAGARHKPRTRWITQSSHGFSAGNLVGLPYAPNNGTAVSWQAFSNPYDIYRMAQAGPIIRAETNRFLVLIEGRETITLSAPPTDGALLYPGSGAGLSSSYPGYNDDWPQSPPLGVVIDGNILSGKAQVYWWGTSGIGALLNRTQHVIYTTSHGLSAGDVITWDDPASGGTGGIAKAGWASGSFKAPKAVVVQVIDSNSVLAVSKGPAWELASVSDGTKYLSRLSVGAYGSKPSSGPLWRICRDNGAHVIIDIGFEGGSERHVVTFAGASGAVDTETINIAEFAEGAKVTVNAYIRITNGSGNTDRTYHVSSQTTVSDSGGGGGCLGHVMKYQYSDQSISGTTYTILQSVDTFTFDRGTTTLVYTGASAFDLDYSYDTATGQMDITSDYYFSQDYEATIIIEIDYSTIELARNQ